MQLVERGSAAKPQLVFEKRIIEEFDHGAADDEVLLDLPIVDPRDGLPPCDDVETRDHSSISGRRRTMTFQRALRSAGSFEATARPGSSSTQGSGRDFSRC
jgi:hypothetical protein